MKDKKKLAYYITGHGFGHATRSIEVINVLVENSSVESIVVVSALNEDFFRVNLNPSALGKWRYQRRTLDTGAFQSTPLDVDAMKTLENYYHNVHLQHEILLEAEVSFLRSHQIDAILVDAVPIACAAGKAAGCKVLLISNFCWDFILEEMFRESQKPPLLASNASVLGDSFLGCLSNMVDVCSRDYGGVDVFFQLPGETPVTQRSELQQKIVSAPLLARLPRNTRTDSRRELEDLIIIKRAKIVATGSYDNGGCCMHNAENGQEDIGLYKWLLLTFGGHATSSQRLDAMVLPAGWLCFVLGYAEAELPEGDWRFISLPLETYVPDVIHAVDAVMGKIGYGTVSECLSTNPPTPLIYVPRSGWPEESYLISLLRRYGIGVELQRSDYYFGRWLSAMEEAMKIAGAGDISGDLDACAGTDDWGSANQRLCDMIAALL